jgi:hypothetical protein
MNAKDIVDGLFTEIRSWVEPALRTVSSRIDAVEAQVKAIPAGPKGDDGLPGADGITGKDGPAGERGLDGQAGADGVAGKDGRDGIDGKDGAPGAAGEKGEPGPAGKDADPEMLESLVTAQFQAMANEFIDGLRA